MVGVADLGADVVDAARNPGAERVAGKGAARGAPLGASVHDDCYTLAHADAAWSPGRARLQSPERMNYRGTMRGRLGPRRWRRVDAPERGCAPPVDIRPLGIELEGADAGDGLDEQTPAVRLIRSGVDLPAGGIARAGSLSRWRYSDRVHVQSRHARDGSLATTRARGSRTRVDWSAPTSNQHRRRAVGGARLTFPPSPCI